MFHIMNIHVAHFFTKSTTYFDMILNYYDHKLLLLQPISHIHGSHVTVIIVGEQKLFMVYQWLMVYGLHLQFISWRTRIVYDNNHGPT